MQSNKTMTFMVTNLTYGLWNLIFTADANNMFIESNESNNNLTYSFYVNQIPQLNLDGLSFNEDGIIQINLWNYTDDDNSSDEVSYTLLDNSDPSNVTVSITDQNLSINPAPNWYGNITITIEVFDGFATVNYTYIVEVKPVNDAPYVANSLEDFSIPINTEDSTTVNLSVVFDDIDSDILNYSYSGNENISVTINPDTTVTFVPGENWTGVETITFYASDGEYTASDDVNITVFDANPPKHSSETPSSGVCITNATPTISVHVTDENESGVNSSTIRLYIQGFSVFYELSTIPGGYNVSYTHEAGFNDGDEVTCRIVAEDLYGNKLDFTWNFTVDISAPSIDSVSPSDGAENLPLNTTISVTFSEQMNKTSAEQAFTISPGVNGSFSWNGNTTIFTPASQLENTTYIATINTGAKDLAGNAVANNYSWSFTAGTGIPPEHSNECPAVGGYTSDTTPTISVHVTDINGVNSSTIKLYVNGYSVSYDLVSITHGYNISYTHETGFSEGDIVTCRIVADDIYGNTLDFTWNFTVQYSFDIPVHVGWNLISYPLLASGDIETVLNDDVVWDNAQWYDPADTGDHWKTHVVGRTLNDLNTIDNTMAVWLHVTNAGDGFLTVSGSAPASSTIQLHAGWNLVSYPASSSTAMNAAGLPVQVIKIAQYDFAAPYLVLEVADWTANNFVPGNGYWLYSTADTTWTVTY